MEYDLFSANPSISSIGLKHLDVVKGRGNEIRLGGNKVKLKGNRVGLEEEEERGWTGGVL